MKLESAYILGVRVDQVRLEQLLALIDAFVSDQHKAFICYVNIQTINLAYSLPWFRKYLNQSDIVFCDGIGVRIAAQILGFRLPYRYTPPDWIPRLCELCIEKNYSLYILGGREGVAERAASRLKKNFQELRIVGMHHGYFDKTQGSKENEIVIRGINSAQPDILIVGFGMPLQEHWLMENEGNLHAWVSLPVGAAIDYLAGEVRRAPRWMTDHGLEWLGRLIVEPRRLWKRYLIGIPLFYWRVLMQKMGKLKFE